MIHGPVLETLMTIRGMARFIRPALAYPHADPLPVLGLANQIWLEGRYARYVDCPDKSTRPYPRLPRLEGNGGSVRGGCDGRGLNVSRLSPRAKDGGPSEESEQTHPFNSMMNQKNLASMSPFSSVSGEQPFVRVDGAL